MPNRRYNYVQYSSGLTLGRKTFCPERVKVKSWLRWFVSCDFCFCYCDYDGADEDKSDRYFSLREATSDIEKNKLVCPSNSFYWFSFFPIGFLKISKYNFHQTESLLDFV